jgi:hypothetical protein
VIRAEELSVGAGLKLISVVRLWRAGNGVSAGAEYSSLLEAVIWKRLVTTLQAVEDFMFTAVICKVLRLTMAL